MPHQLHKALQVPPYRQYPVLMGCAYARGHSHDAPAPRCQRGGCNEVARFARVWLSPTELGRFTLSGLRHGVYYCAEHAHEARETTNVPVLETVESIEAYHRQVIDDAAPAREASKSAEVPRVPAKLIVAQGPRGLILRLHDDSLEVAPLAGDPVKVCCRMQARLLVGEYEPAPGAREHSRTCQYR